ncbi:MAG: hypothetical protein JO153_20400, partial [Solirubrobacterales bacterium]|nr:hypothetical protein [Solirubrobacterales bacterium]
RFAGARLRSGGAGSRFAGARLRPAAAMRKGGFGGAVLARGVAGTPPGVAGTPPGVAGTPPGVAGEARLSLRRCGRRRGSPPRTSGGG